MKSLLTKEKDNESRKVLEDFTKLVEGKLDDPDCALFLMQCSITDDQMMIEVVGDSNFNAPNLMYMLELYKDNEKRVNAIYEDE